jgi:hypothetical protein
MGLKHAIPELPERLGVCAHIIVIFANERPLLGHRQVALNGDGCRLGIGPPSL